MAATDIILVKKPHQIETWTEEQVIEFAKCADPVTGPEYFMSNYFYIQHPTKGRMLYEPFDYQKRLINTYHNYRFSISLMPRQTGKSTSAAGYLLWYAFFVPDSTILISAHKFTGSQEIMQRIRYAYESVPDFIRAGAVNYNKGSIDFDNGSRILSATTTENTGRGMSISLLYADEFAFVRSTIGREFWTSISPTLATGGKCIITSTPNSDEDQFATLWKGANKCVDEFGNATELGINGFKAFRSYWREHPDRDDAWGIAQRAQLGDDRFRREMDCLAHSVDLQLELNNEQKIITIGELFNIIDTSTEVIYKENKHGYKVLTPDGYKSFVGIRCLGKKAIYRIELDTNYWIECTANHKVFVNDAERVTIDELVVGDIVLTNSGNQQVSAKLNLGREELVYDLIEVDGGHRYYTNGILSSNCEFIIWDETLINPGHLIEMSGIDPIERQGQIRWYKKPSPANTYLVALDPSLGTGGDPAAIQIFELPSFIQIGEWQHNRTPIQQQIGILREITRYLAETIPANNIYYSTENNTIGEAALVTIASIGEENIKGIFLHEPRKNNNYRKGFNTTNKSKLSACAKLKNLIETKRLTIYSKNLISELKTFVRNGTSFAAKPGETDDLVMSLVLIVRMAMILQTYDATLDNAIRDNLDDFVEPLPFIIL